MNDILLSTDLNLETFRDVILVAASVYLFFFKSYFKYKGKNLATSEDIEVLTEKFEKVKDTFVEKNAYLKSKLDIITNIQISQVQDEKNALINFHKNLSFWVDLLTEVSPYLINEYDNKEIDIKIYSYDESYKNVITSKALLELHLNEDDVLRSIHRLISDIVNHLSEHGALYLIECKMINFKLDIVEERIRNNKTETESEYSTKEHENLLNEKRVLRNKYRENIKKGNEEIFETKAQYLKSIREYLSNLSEA